MTVSEAQYNRYVVFNRITGVLQNASLRQKLGISLLRLYYRVSAPFGRLGISRISKLLGTIFLPIGSTKYILDKDATYIIPSGDYYWSTLYIQSHTYEPELGLALKLFADIDFILLDIGANYGFWSVLSSSPNYGSKPAIAVEASGRTFEILQTNSAANRNSFRTVHNAIWSVKDNDVKLFGSRHGGMSVKSERTGVDEAFELVKTTTIDDILVKNSDLVGNKSLVIKLDVEGVEDRAIEGAKKALEREYILILEEDKWENFGNLVINLRDSLGCKIYFYNRNLGRWLSVVTDQDVYDIKKTERHLRQAGFNFFVAKAESKFDRAMAAIAVAVTA